MATGLSLFLRVEDSVSSEEAQSGRSPVQMAAGVIGP